MSTTDNRSLAFWLLADDTLRDALDTSQRGLERMKARLLHTLVFNVFEQKLAISDTALIDNNCLRMLLRTDETTQRLFADQMIIMAARADQGGVARDLEDIEAEHIRAGRCKFKFEQFGRGRELSFVSQCSTSVPFRLGELADNYTKEVLRLLGSPVGAQLLTKPVAEHVYHLGRERKENTGQLNWHFFFSEVEQFLTPEDWHLYKSKINDIAQTPYHTGLPTLLRADPIYAEEHAVSFELVRGSRQQYVVDQCDYDFAGRLGLAAFEQGILKLSADDVNILLDSEEARHMVQSRDAFDATDTAKQELVAALQQYVYRVEEQIIRADRALLGQSADGSQRTINVGVEEFEPPSLLLEDMTNVGLNILGSFYLTFSVLGVVKSIFDTRKMVRIGEMVRKEERRKAAELSAAKEGIMMSLAGTPIISHELIREVPTTSEANADTTKAQLGQIETRYK
jgi:hypothetical protein